MIIHYLQIGKIANCWQRYYLYYWADELDFVIMLLPAGAIHPSANVSGESELIIFSAKYQSACACSLMGST